MLAYTKRKTLLIALLWSVVAAVPSTLAAGKAGRAGNPAFQSIAAMTKTSPPHLRLVLQSTPEILLQQLQQRGYKATSYHAVADRAC